MIRYAFLAQLTPPAPFVNVVLRNPANSNEIRDLPAQIDTAADRTIVPESLVRSLRLPQIGAARFAGLGGIAHSLPLFAAQIGLHDLPARTVKVAAHADEPWILLGRDVINSIRLTLDGPKLMLEIE